ncbi:MAG: hypothetical protein R3E32_16485 [Chitinophagales bacterium]
MNFKKNKPKALTTLLVLLSFAAYYLLAYRTLRTEVYQVFALFGVLFLAYGLLYQSVKDAPTYRFLLIAAILFRVLLLFALPNLSDDFYRFNWDGRLLGNGISPFEALPIHFIDGTYQGLIPNNINLELYSQLNSPQYFTIYPPVCQFIFWFACSFFPNDLYGATALMKTCLLLFEVGSIYLLYRMVQRLGLQPKKTLLYALNPLVIVELTGNVHFEAAMIFFILLAVWFLLDARSKKQEARRKMKDERRRMEDGGRKTLGIGQWVMDYKHWGKEFWRCMVGSPKVEVKTRSWVFSAAAMGLAISSKLIPMIFLPFFIRLLGWRKGILYGAIAGMVTLFGFVPLFTFDILQNLLSSIGLYFQKFEFNASIYYLVRWIGYQVYGYNIIQTAGRNLAILTLVGIMAMAFWENKNWGNEKSVAAHLKTLLQGFLFALLIYFAFANIVHPWYVSSLVALCIFTPFRFPIVWSGMVVLTYYTYLTDAYTENLYLVGFEYFVVCVCLIWELKTAFLTKTLSSAKSVS